MEQLLAMANACQQVDEQWRATLLGGHHPGKHSCLASEMPVWLDGCALVCGCFAGLSFTAIIKMRLLRWQRELSIGLLTGSLFDKILFFNNPNIFPQHNKNKNNNYIGSWQLAVGCWSNKLTACKVYGMVQYGTSPVYNYERITLRPL
jgi:hypothetical protein